MITRLQVDGFKNLIGVDIRFGPFTCIAGHNGVGKSNLFDAIRFLSSLASKSLTEAAVSVRDERRSSDIRSVFHRCGAEYDDRMSFVVEMIVSPEAVDDLGQPARATNTLLRYSLDLGWRIEPNSSAAALEIQKEELIHLTLGSAAQNLRFPHTAATWRATALKGRGYRRGKPFISTSREDNGSVVIRRHQDGSGGNPMPSLAKNLPRTVLSVATAAEAPTALCARREMESWLLLQLEPSALRRPDDINTPSRMSPNGAGLPATLFRLGAASADKEGVYATVANRLSELIEDVRTISVDRDEKRDLLALSLAGRDGTVHPARSLSDGTLRFLALTVLEMDRSAGGVICLEEPENGIHPDRIASMLRLLKDMATDPTREIGEDNPLRQVILNTHSPLVVSECDDDALLLARPMVHIRNGKSFHGVIFSAVPGTWRDDTGIHHVISRGQLLAYLQPQSLSPSAAANRDQNGPRKVRDRFVDPNQSLLSL